MADGMYPFPVALTWSQEPQKLKKLKNKVHTYFQSKSKSGGGECEVRDTDCSRGYLLIHFKEEAARDRVLQKKGHQLKLPDGETILLDVHFPDHTSEAKTSPPPQDGTKACKAKKMKLPEKEAPPEKEVVSPESSSFLVLMQNIKDSFTPEMLCLLVENISVRSADTDFQVERIPEIQSAVVTFTCDIDLADFIERFSSDSKVKNQKIAAKGLEECRSVRVEGIPPNTPKDMVLLYFESSKSGGDVEAVEDVVMLSDENAAVVTFKQAGVLNRVMTRQHVLQNTELSVYPYYTSIGHCLYGDKGPRTSMPDPVDVPITPQLLEFILKDVKIKPSFNEAMANVYCDITWPDVGHPKPVIRLSLSRTLHGYLRTLAKVAPSWSNNVRKEFERLMSKYKIVECDLKPPVYEAIRTEISGPSYHGVLILPDLAAEKAFIVGTSEDVQKIEPKFRKLVEDTTRQLSRVEDEVPLETAAYKLLLAYGLEKSIRKDSPNVNISYDGPSKMVKLCGPRSEVLTAKCDILNFNLKSKPFQLDSHIIRFLKGRTGMDNEELSSRLFMKNNIKTIFHVEDNSVVLTSFSDSDLRNAEETLKKQLVCKRISVEDKSVTQSPQWPNLKTQLNKKFNVKEMTVSIEEFPMSDGCEVVIAGLSPSAEESFQRIHYFVEMNTMVQKDVKLKSAAILQFIEEERKQNWESISRNVKVVKKPNFITLSGPKLYVEEAETCVRKMMADLHSDTLYIDKPGVKKFFLDNEDMYVTTIKNKHNCVIHLQKEVDDKILLPKEPYCQVSLQNGGTIVTYKGDLCQHNADVIIISSNKSLKPTGNLAVALVNSAGRGLQKECDDIIQKEGEPAPGECVITDAGNLHCKALIHAVAHEWDKKTSSSERLLRRAISSSLETAEKNGQSMVALSVGDFVTAGCPLDACAENIVRSIKMYVTNNAPTISIHLVESDEAVLKTITTCLKDEFDEINVQLTQQPGIKKQKTKTPKKVETDNKATSKAGQMVMTKEGLNININQGNIEDSTTDVVVNSVGSELKLSSGAVSRALYTKAGNKLQDLLNAERAGTQAEDGSIFVTDGCNLSCDLVLHAVVPAWDGENGSSEKILRKILSDCLSTTESKQLRSITFPAMGAGVLGFPKRVLAAVMLEEILEFSSRAQPQYLKQVNFMLHPGDPDTIKVFSAELEKRINNGGQKKDKSFFGNIQSPAKDVYEMMIGSVTYQVKTGDITAEKCDVIINSTNTQFNLKTGVSKVILERAGPEIENECVRLGTQPNNGYVVTQGGQLNCKKIIHISGTNRPNLISKCVTNALHMCESQQATSVAFPAMGTGVGGVSSAEVANAILEAVVGFAKSNSVQTVQNVTVVVFQKQMLKDFHESMKKKEPPVPSKSNSWFSVFTAPIKALFGGNQSDKATANEKEEEEEQPKVFEMRENIEPAIFHLCGESRESVKQAVVSLRELVTKDQHDNTIADKSIQDFDAEDHKRLSDLQRQSEVHMFVDTANCTISVSGLTSDVLKVSNTVHEIIKSVRDKKTQEQEAELCSQEVEWGYYQGTNFVPFDKITNLKLEKGSTDKSSSVDIDISGVKYTVIMELKSARDATGNKVELQRNPKNAGSLTTPPYWDPMDSGQLKVVPLNSNSPDYSEVVDLFRQTCLMKIIKIQRIQNKHLYQNYQIRKNSINTKYDNRNNEKKLFHGTEITPTDNINLQGFNRGYAGSNDAKLGKGTYFAVEANYSADDTYSKPDADGHKYMYLARVLTGTYCVGKREMIAPPAKNPSNPTDLYDSVTDNTSDPKVFVIFNDVQAYPEYLITFTK